MLVTSNPATAAPVAAIAPMTTASQLSTAMAAAQTSQAAKPAAATAAKVVYLANGQAVSTVQATPASVIARAPLAISRNLPLYALVATYAAGAPLDEQTQCLAVTVYHEARGETLEGQLAVANVVINRAKSGRYPPTWCEVMKQPWQFSFVNPKTGRYPGIDTASAAWSKAQAIARIAAHNVAAEVDQDVLWYHADYVAPSWGRRLTRVEKIGTHIFYRA